MDYKQLLISIIDKKRDSILEQDAYKSGLELIEKLETISNDLNKIELLTSNDVSLFSLPERVKIVKGIKAYVLSGSYDEREIKNWISVLKNDIFDNFMFEYNRELLELDSLYNIISSDSFYENTDMIFAFINDCYENGIIGVAEAINLNIFILSKCSEHSANLIEEVESEEVVELEVNDESVEEELKAIFAKYGYNYDDLGKVKENFAKYAKVDYVDYVLAKFSNYGVIAADIPGYALTLFKIVLDKDKESFDSIFNFIDKNDCSLRFLLRIPSVFSKRKRTYVPRGGNIPGDGRGPRGGDKDFKIDGANEYFFKNIEIYKRLTGRTVISDLDLEELVKYLSTPTKIVEKNLMLLNRYKIISSNEFPSSSVSLCGIHTEYLIDRFIECGLYDIYLSPISRGGKTSKPKGSSYLSGTNRAFKFYKIKRATDLGEELLASNGGLRNIFQNDNADYLGICLRQTDGKEYIIQEPLSASLMEAIPSNKRKIFPPKFYIDRDGKNYDRDKIAAINFKNMYEYKVFSPVQIFAKDDLKGELLNKVFLEHYSDTTLDESVLDDPYIKMLDSAYYTDNNGNHYLIKQSDLIYEFSHYSFPNVKVIISRNKVLRLCSLLKKNNLWLDSSSSNRQKVDILLSVLLKDTIISEYERDAVRFITNLILSGQLTNVEHVGRGVSK